MSSETSEAATLETPNAAARHASAPLVLANNLEQLYSICVAFEKNYDTSEATREGVFYTPVALAQKMVQRCAHALAEKPSPIVLDLACGSGVFALALLERLFLERPKDLCRFIRSGLYCVDKDPNAVAITQAVILKAFEILSGSPAKDDVREALDQHVVVGNTLLDSFKLAALSTRFSEVAKSGGFDLIIGNPPYGLSRGGKLSPEENEALKLSFAASRDGKINKYLAFMARGYDLLRERGTLSLVVPNAWLGINGGRKLRRMFLEDRSLEEVCRFSYPVFDKPGVEAVVFKVTRAGLYEKIKIRTCHLGGDEEVREVPVSYCLEDPDTVIPLEWTDEVAEILRHIRARSRPLSDPTFPFEARIALQAYAEGKGVPPQTAEQVKTHPFHSNIAHGKDWLPYLEGKDVQRYQVSWSGSFLHYGPWLAEPQKLERFCETRVVLREITNPLPYLLHAAVAETPMLYNKSVLHVTLKPGSNPDEAWALLTILNSRLGSFLIYHCGRKTQRRLFPKIVNEDLKCFLLPITFNTHVERLAAKAKEMQLLHASRAEQKAVAKLQQEMDLLVCEAYEIPERMREALT